MAGKIQDADIKSSAELVAAGATAASLPNANKIYITGLTKTLDAAITAGDLLGTAHSSATSTHGVSGNIVGTSDTQVLTNKDIDGGTAANNRRLTVPKNTKANLDSLTRKEGTLLYATDEAKYYLDNGSALVAVGTGAGGTNFITSADGSSLTGWATYADAAGTAPVDGTGGSPSSTLAVSTDSSLVGTTNLLWTKSAANRQGEGFSFAFTIDQAYQAKPCTISFLYRVASGTYASGDMSVWIYDVTNGVMIQPSAYTIENGSGALVEKCEFQTASNSTSYRLIIHTSSTSASAYTLRFDAFSVSPNTYNVGSINTAWQQYTMTIGATTTAPTKGTNNVDNAQWRRVGDSIEVMYNYRQTGAGSAGSGQYLFPLPSGLTIDTAKIGATAVKASSILGTGYASTNGTDTYSCQVNVYNSTNLALYSVYATGTSDAIGSAAIPLSGASVQYSFFARVPIAGWGTAQVLSSETDTRVVAAIYNTTVSANASTTNPVQWSNRVVDTHGAVTTGSSWKFTAPVAGIYCVAPSYYNTTAGTVTSYLYKNGTLYGAVGSSVSNSFASGGSILISLNAGDYIDVRESSSVTVAADANSNISIHRLSGPSQIAASETVSAKYTAPTQTITVSLAVVKYLTKSFDTHGAYNTSTGVFTVPVAGKYIVQASIEPTANIGAGSINQAIYAQVFKNGSVDSNCGRFQWATTSALYANINGSTILNCIAGDTLELRASQNTGNTYTCSGDAMSALSFTRIGN